ncbi:unnamed protein product, partial [Effrenium voratum]
RYSDGKAAVLRHTDGSGFAYYPSGRKAVCISASGLDGAGRARRFSAVIHNDSNRNPIVGVFDEWGLGYAEGMVSAGDAQPPKLLISDKAMTVLDGSGKATEVPRTKPTTDLVLRVNKFLTLRHKGRTFLDFQCEGVSHTMTIGEMHGDEVDGMAMASEKKTLSEESTQQLQEATLKLEGVQNLAKTLQVASSQRELKSTAPALGSTATVKDVLDQLATLKTSLSHPNLAPDLKWDTEIRLKKMLAKVHPQCPGRAAGWKISRVSGKCTEERLANAKPTVNAPRSIAQVSQLKLPDLIAENASSTTLLVVVCLAAYAKEQSNYARLLAEKAHAALWHRFCSKPESGPLPVRLVAVELTEANSFTEQYGVKEVPYCLMFLAGQQVYAKRLHGIRMAPRDAAAAKPKVLLVEANPAVQLKLERNLRRNGYGSDLAMDTAQAARLANSEAYGVLLISACLPAEQLRSVFYAVRSKQREAVLLAFDGTMLQGEELEERKQFLEECSYVFPYNPSYTGLAAILARFDVTHVDKGLACVPCTSHKQDFLDDVLGVLESGGYSPGDKGVALAPGLRDQGV